MARMALLSLADEAVRASVAARLQLDGITVTDAAGHDVPETIDILVLDFLSPAPRRFIGSDPAEWFAGVHAALTAPFQLIRSAAPALSRSEAGRIVLIGRGWSAAGDADSTAAAAVHGAAIALMKTLARDLGPAGITVNKVAMPSGRVDTTAAAAAVGYLVSPLAGATTGQILSVGRGGELRP